MGALKEETDLVYDKPEKLVKTSIAGLCSFLISIVGGLVLVWWEFEHHPSNSQLWMVPFGLILFVTPVTVWIAIVASDLGDSLKVDVSCPSRPVVVLVDSIRDPERFRKEINYDQELPLNPGNPKNASEVDIYEKKN